MVKENCLSEQVPQIGQVEAVQVHCNIVDNAVRWTVGYFINLYQEMENY